MCSSVWNFSKPSVGRFSSLFGKFKFKFQTLSWTICDVWKVSKTSSKMIWVSCKVSRPWVKQFASLFEKFPNLGEWVFKPWVGFAAKFRVSRPSVGWFEFPFLKFPNLVWDDWHVFGKLQKVEDLISLESFWMGWFASVLGKFTNLEWDGLRVLRKFQNLQEDDLNQCFKSFQTLSETICTCLESFKPLMRTICIIVWKRLPNVYAQLPCH